jgi:hypothetical protein
VTCAPVQVGPSYGYTRTASHTAANVGGIVDLFRGYAVLGHLLDQSDQGRSNLLLPTTATADTESDLRHWVQRLGSSASDPEVRSLQLTEHAAIETGCWKVQHIAVIKGGLALSSCCNVGAAAILSRT